MSNRLLIKKFFRFASDHRLFTSSDHLLLAVSGGCDSMLMAWLFKEAGLSFAIAHCNFQLRAADSQSDEDLVARWAEANKIACNIKRFDTLASAQNGKISVQMAARLLRFDWFNSLMLENSYAAVATGHHLEDSTETMLINLLRGTGIKGLRGIQPRKGSIIRPILFLSKPQIREFVNQNQIPYREDGSNVNLKYVRNSLRRNVIPLLRDINPSLHLNFFHTAARLTTAEKFYQEKASALKKRIVTQEGNRTLFAKQPLNKLGADSVTLLYDWLAPFGFSFSQAISIVQVLKQSQGKLFTSSTHELRVERSVLSLVLKQPLPPLSNMELKLMARKNVLDFSQVSTNCALLNADDLCFPLIKRNWIAGDRIIPFGMTGSKKLSDLFIDRKVEIFQKHRLPVVVSGSDLVWVPGLCISNKYRVEENSKWVLRLIYHPPPVA